MRYAFVYDGDCEFCRASVSAVQGHMAVPVAYVPYQSLPLDRYGLDEAECQKAAHWVDLETGEVSAGYFAFAEALRASECPPWQALSTVMLIPFVAWLGTRFYNVVSQTRSLSVRRLIAARRFARVPVPRAHAELRVVLASPGESQLLTTVPETTRACACSGVNFALSHSLLALSLLLWRWSTDEVLGYGWGWQMYS